MDAIARGKGINTHDFYQPVFRGCDTKPYPQKCLSAHAKPVYEALSSRVSSEQEGEVGMGVALPFRERAAVAFTPDLL